VVRTSTFNDRAKYGDATQRALLSFAQHVWEVAPPPGEYFVGVKSDPPSVGATLEKDEARILFGLSMISSVDDDKEQQRISVPELHVKARAISVNKYIEWRNRFGTIKPEYDIEICYCSLSGMICESYSLQKGAAEKCSFLHMPSRKLYRTAGE
jgi:hypothetical protein